MRARFLGGDEVFCFISICRFGSFQNPFAMITSLSEIHFRFRRFILLVQQKKWFIWTMAAAQAAENHGYEWGLTWYLQWAIYRSIPTSKHSQNSVAAEAPSWKIFSHGTSLKWSQDCPNQHKNILKLCNEMGHLVLSYMESQWKLRQLHDQNFPMEGKPL